MRIAGRGSLVCSSSSMGRWRRAASGHSSSLVFATELLGSLASGAWRRDRGGGAGEGQGIADLGVVGWAEQQHDGALTLGLGEHGLSVIICEHGQQRPRHCLVKLDSRFGPSGLTPESYVLAVGLSFGRPECLINRVMRPSCRPAVRLPSRRARLSPARLNPGCARGC